MKLQAFLIFALLVASQTTVVFSADEGEDKLVDNFDPSTPDPPALRMQAFEARLEKLENQVDESYENPMFFAKRNDHTKERNPATKMYYKAYDEVAVNVGKGLDAFSGIFKAPVKGVYYFHASSIGQPGMKAELRHNDKPFISKIVPKGKQSDIFFPNDLQATLTLKKDDTVSVRFEANHGAWKSWNYYGPVTFTGFLIRRSALQLDVVLGG